LAKPISGLRSADACGGRRRASRLATAGSTETACVRTSHAAFW
jgi:hypothetical protein